MTTIPSYLSKIQELVQPLTGLKGIGPKRAEALDRAGDQDSRGSPLFCAP